MLAIVAAETAGPNHVADVVRIARPARLHLREEIIGINLLDGRGGGHDARVIGILRGQRYGDPGLRLIVRFVRPRQDIDGISLDPRN